MTTSDGTILSATKIVDNGPDALKWTLVLLPDGYQSGQMAQWHVDAQAFASAFFAEPPFTDPGLAAAINMYRIDVTSTDTGADDPNPCGTDNTGSGATSMTYFDATFCYGGATRRLLGADRTTARSVASAQVPEWDQVLIIVNSATFGGSGGDVSVTSLANGGGHTWQEIAIHEIGHSAFHLADEYEYLEGCSSGETGHDDYIGSEPMEPNVTTDSNRNSIKWRGLIDAATPMPTTQNANCSQCDSQLSPLAAGAIGAFEGAHHFHCGLFRPAFDCMMRNFGTFCLVCEQQIRGVLAWRGFELAPARVARAKAAIAAVSRVPDSMEIWWVSDNGSIQGAKWYDSIPSTPWHHYPFAPSDSASPAGGIAAVSRVPGSMEVWWVGTDGSVKGAKWYDTTPPTAWQHYDLAPPGSASLSSGVGAVSHSPGSMEVWWVGTDGSVKGAKWYDTTPPTAWQHYDLAPPGSASLSSGVGAVSHSPGSMEVWWVGTDGSVKGAKWYDTTPPTNWDLYELAPPRVARAVRAITAVSRIPGSMEVWWVSDNGSVQGAKWYDTSPPTGWQLYQLASPGSASDTGGIAAVSRIPGSLEVWWVSDNGSVQDAFWYDSDPPTDWRLFQLAPAGSASVSSGVAAVSRIPGSMEVWWVTENGSVNDMFWYGA